MAIWVTLRGTCRVSWWHAGNIAVAQHIFPHSPSPGQASTIRQHCRIRIHATWPVPLPFTEHPLTAHLSTSHRTTPPVPSFEGLPVSLNKCHRQQMYYLLVPFNQQQSPLPTLFLRYYYYGTCLVIVSRNELSLHCHFSVILRNIPVSVSLPPLPPL